jgi:tRNA A22 N-methylase
MTAPIRHSEIRIDPLAVFKARAEARAILWAACEIDLHEAVDVLQADAVSTGLVAGLGQDAMQRILADAFHRFRAHEVPQ